MQVAERGQAGQRHQCPGEEKRLEKPGRRRELEGRRRAHEPELIVNGPREGRLPNILHITVPSADQEGLIIPVVITIFSDRSFTFITKTPPVPVLVKRAVAIAKGSAEPNKNKVGKITEEQVAEIAKIKMPDLNCFDIDAAKAQVRGACRSMGVDVI